MKKFLFLILALAVTESQCKISSSKDRAAWQEEDKRLEQLFNKVKYQDNKQIKHYLRSIIFHQGLKIKNNLTIYSQLMKDLTQEFKRARTYQNLIYEIKSEKYSYAFSNFTVPK